MISSCGRDGLQTQKEVRAASNAELAKAPEKSEAQKILDAASEGVAKEILSKVEKSAVARKEQSDVAAGTTARDEDAVVVAAERLLCALDCWRRMLADCRAHPDLEGGEPRLGCGVQTVVQHHLAHERWRERVGRWQLY